LHLTISGLTTGSGKESRGAAVITGSTNATFESLNRLAKLEACLT